MVEDIEQRRVIALLQQGVQRYQAGRYDEAAAFIQDACNLAERRLGEQHPLTATGLFNLAEIYCAQGRYSEAEPLCRRVLAIWEQVLGPDHPDVAQGLNTLTGLYRAQGRYAEAEPLCRRVLAIWEQVLGPDHPDVAISLIGLAELYRAQGRYGEAEPLYHRALAIDEQALGPHHSAVAAVLDNLALLYGDQGRYAEAEPLCQRALAIWEALGPDHRDVAISLGNRATLYFYQGRYAEAELLFRRALAIWEQVLGPDHPDVAQGLNNLAVLYHDQGRAAEAAPLCRRALTIRERALGPDHPDVAQTLNNLAGLYHDQGCTAEAEPLYRRALAIRERAFGPRHPAIAGSLNNLAELYRAQGRTAEAELLHRRALAIKEQALGLDHPDVALSLDNLACLLITIGYYADALAALERVSRINDRLIGQMFACLSERQRSAYLNTLRDHSDRYLSLVARHLAAEPTAVRAALALVLRRKALGAEALAAQRDAVLGGRYPHLQPRLRELTALRMQIAQKTLAGPGDGDPEAYRRQLAEWTTQREQMEAELTRQIPEMNLTQRLAAADLQAVANVLPKDTALVEFVRFNVFDFQTVPAKGERPWKEARYLAFVLPAGEPDRVQMLDLGEAAFIDRRIARFRAAITGESEPRRDLGALPTTHRDDGAGIELRQAVFDPLLPALGDRQQLLLSPDGDLTRLPFEVLPTDEGYVQDTCKKLSQGL